MLGVLGSLEVRASDGRLDRATGLPRELLTLLALRAGRWVRAEELVEELWQGRPPRSAGANIRALVCRWRKTLPVAARIDGQRGGYRLTVARHVFDVRVFEDLVADGRRSTDRAAAVRSFETALGLWRGEPFEGLGSCAQAERTRLTELRELAIGGLVRALFELERHAETVPILRAATIDWPYHEQFWADLIEALCRCGRRADAVVAYRTVAALLADELGVSPGPVLRDRQEQLLTEPNRARDEPLTRGARTS